MPITISQTNHIVSEGQVGRPLAPDKLVADVQLQALHALQDDAHAGHRVVRAATLCFAVFVALLDARAERLQRRVGV